MEHSEVKSSGPSLRKLFPETSITLLEKAREQSDEGSRARDEFANRYYYPVNKFLLALVRDAEEADELSQEFFAKLVKPGGILRYSEREKGSFRDYLMSSLRHFYVDEYRRRRRRLGDVHPDQGNDSRWDAIDVGTLPEAEAAFHRTWVQFVLAEALGRVRTLCVKRRQDVHFALFEARYLGTEDRPTSWQKLGEPYGMDQKTARERADLVADHLRYVLRRMLRNEIAGSAGMRVTNAALDEEIKALLAPLKD